MYVTTKISLTLVTAFAVLCLAIWISLELAIGRSFQQLEYEKSRENFQRVQNAISRELIAAQSLVSDYGEWNQAYDFMIGDNPDFVTSQLPHSVLIDSQMNIAIYYSFDREIMGGVAIDLRTEEPKPISDYALTSGESWAPFPEGMHGDYISSRVVNSPMGLMLMGTSPVRKTDATGNYVGHLLVGRLIDNDWLENIQNQTRVAFQLEHVALEEASVTQVSANSKTPKLDLTTEVQGEFVSVSTIIHGPNGNPLAKLRVQTPRQISQVGRRSLEIAMGFLVAAILICLLIVNRSVSALVIRPIERLTSIMSSADTAPSVRSPIFKNRDDEIGILFNTFQDLIQRIEDRTAELAEAVSAAEAAERAKATFLANMSHEIRTPLNGVLGMAQALDSDSLNSEQKGKVETILDSGSILMAVVNDVLDLSKIESGKLEISPIPNNLKDCISKLVRFWEPQAKEKNLSITIEIEDDVPAWFSFDSVRVSQCISNLISNALKFTKKGFVELRVTAEKLADDNFEIKIAVKDSGIGITQEEQDKIFSAFSQADISTTRRFGGTGLGLTISRNLARMMGGDVSITSTPGEGSTFTFAFHASRVCQSEIDNVRNSVQPSEQRPMIGTLQGKRILLVDDNEVNRKVVHVFLAAQNVSVTDAANGSEALDLLDAQEFDLVLLDIQMPVMDGIETIRRIRSESTSYSSIPVIALTADAMDGDKERYLSMGMNGYIPKPIDPKKLISESLHALSRPAHSDFAA